MPDEPDDADLVPDEPAVVTDAMLEEQLHAGLRPPPFPLTGVRGWPGHRYLIGAAVQGGEIYAVTLGHLGAGRRSHVAVETASRPGQSQLARLLRLDEREPDGDVVVRVDGQAVRCTRYGGGRSERWRALGRVGALEIGVDARGVDAAELDLTVGVDPEPYIAGRLAGPPGAGGTGSRR